jgi:hypothetical protein
MERAALPHPLFSYDLTVVTSTTVCSHRQAHSRAIEELPLLTPAHIRFESPILRLQGKIIPRSQDAPQEVFEGSALRVYYFGGALVQLPEVLVFQSRIPWVRGQEVGLVTPTWMTPQTDPR